jgi:hypothetical protein
VPAKHFAPLEYYKGPKDILIQYRQFMQKLKYEKRISATSDLKINGNVHGKAQNGQKAEPTRSM